MSQIINPERRDPSFSRLKADVGLSKVNNVSLSEILVLAKDQIKEEVNRGDVYATQELSSSNRKPIYIPLCRFKDNSSWANIIIGLIDSSSNVLSFVEIKVIHTKDIGLNLSISAAPENSLWGIIKFHLAENGNKDELYFSLPYNSYSKYKISGVTINVKDYLISTSGSSVSSNIEILSHSSIIDSLTSKQTIDLKSLNRRDISSSTESLAVYKDNEPYFPSSSEDLNKGNYDLPRINGVPFTGDKDLKYGGKSTRDITITAQHSGKSVGEAGIHDWEVLEGIPIVGYKNTGESEESKDNSTNTSTTPKPHTTPLPGITEGTSTPQPLSLEDVEESETKTEGRATTVTYTYGTDALGKGLCRLVDIPELPETSGSAWQNMANLKGLVNEVSSLNDEHVVSIGFLRKYTELLLRLFELTGGDSVSSGNCWFLNKGSLKDTDSSEVINNSKKNGLSVLLASPIAGKYTTYQFCSLFSTELPNPKSVFLSIEDTNYKLRKTGNSSVSNLIELGPSKVISGNNVETYSQIYSFDILSEKDVSLSGTIFGGKSIELKVYLGDPTGIDYSHQFTIKISPDVFSSAKEECIFRDGINYEYKLPVVFTRAGYFNEDENSERKFNRFSNYISESEFLTCTKKTNSTTGGLIWKSFNSSKYEIGCNLPPKNDWFKKTKKSLLLEFFSISSNLTITNKTQGSITIYNSGFRGLTTIGPNGSTSIETEVGDYSEYTEDLFDYRNILKNNYSSNSSSYKYYLKFDISSNKDNLNIEEAVNLGSIIFSSSSEYATLNVYQRPDILRWAVNTNLYKLFSPYGRLDWSTEIPVNLNYESTELSTSFTDNLNFISELKTQKEGYLVLSDSKSGNLILSGSGKEDLAENKTVTYSLENQDVYWNLIGNKYYPLEFIPENDSTHSSEISGYEYVGDTVITSIIPDLPTTSATYSISTNLSDVSGSLRKIMVILSTGNSTPWTKYTPEFELTFVRKSSDGFASENCSTECYVSKEASNSKVKATLIKREDGIETWNWKESTAITLPSYTSTEGVPPGIIPYSKLVRTVRFEQTEFDQPQYYDTFGDNTITYEITFIFTTKYSVITDSSSGLTNSRPGLIIDNNTDLIL